MRPLAVSAVAPAAALVLAACSGGWVTGADVQGSGKPATQTFPVAGPFTAVRADGAIHLVVERGETAAISATADDNVLPLLRTAVEDGTLRLWTDGGWSSTTEFVVRVTAPAVAGLHLTGATEAVVDRLESKEAAWIVADGATKAFVHDTACAALTVRVTGASHVAVTKSAGAKLEVKAAGASNVTVSGAFDDVKVQAEGACKVGDATLRAKRADAVAAGASHIDLDVAEFLKADATGASSVRWGGEPKVEGTVGKAATVKPR